MGVGGGGGVGGGYAPWQSFLYVYNTSEMAHRYLHTNTHTCSPILPVPSSGEYTFSTDFVHKP